MYELKPIPQITIKNCNSTHERKRAAIYADLFIYEYNRKYYYQTYDNSSGQYYVRITRLGNIIVEKI